MITNKKHKKQILKAQVTQEKRFLSIFFQIINFLISVGGDPWTACWGPNLKGIWGGFASLWPLLLVKFASIFGAEGQGAEGLYVTFSHIIWGHDTLSLTVFEMWNGVWDLLKNRAAGPVKANPVKR